MNICTLNNIAPIGLDRLGDQFTISDNMANANGVLVRSGAMHDLELNDELLAIARAGAGTNNIPIEKCSSKGIVVFNTPGANANGVKELAIGALVLSSRNVLAAADWAKTLAGEGADVPKLVEKGKGQFVGPELKGKKLGVIGLGAIGVMVANTAISLGMDVCGYDPYISINAAWHLKGGVKHSTKIEELFSTCDYITLHLPATKNTKGMINAQAIASMKDDVRILNLSRDALVNEQDILDAVNSGKVACYVTDFPVEAHIGVKNIIAIPHLGASTPESEDNCAVMAVDQLQDYLLNGNIANSVNMPCVELARTDNHRICIFHDNLPGVLNSLTGIASDANLNIENMVNKSRDNIAYTILEVKDAPSQEIIDLLKNAVGTYRIRVI